MAHDLVDGGADRLGEVVVVQRRRVRPGLDVRLGRGAAGVKGRGEAYN